MKGGRGKTRMIKSPMSRKEQEDRVLLFFIPLLLMQKVKTRMSNSPMSKTIIVFTTHMCEFLSVDRI